MKTLYLTSFFILLISNLIFGQFDNYYSWIEQHPDVKTEILDGNIKVTHLYKEQIRILYENKHLSSDSLKSIYVTAIFYPYIEVWGAFFNESSFSIWLDDNWELLNNPNDPGITLPFKTDFDSMFISLSERFVSITENMPKGDWCLFYGTGGNMGGLMNGIMWANLLNIGHEEKGFSFNLPHEMNHQVFKVSNKDDRVLLRRVIDEGFACYINHLFWDSSYTHADNIGFTEIEWQWALDHEKMIYEQFMKDFDSRNDSIIMKYSKWHEYIWDNSPDRMAYFIGYRIIQAYVANNGVDSWKEIYNMPIREVLERSKYQEFLDSRNATVYNSRSYAIAGLRGC